MLLFTTVLVPCVAPEPPASTLKIEEPQMMKAATSATALTRSARLHRFQSDLTSRIGSLSRLEPSSSNLAHCLGGISVFSSMRVTP